VNSIESNKFIKKLEKASVDAKQKLAHTKQTLKETHQQTHQQQPTQNLNNFCPSAAQWLASHVPPSQLSSLGL